MATGTSFDLRNLVSDDASDDGTTPLLTSYERDYQKERFFEELFQEKCQVSVEQTEISFIQKNVECFVAKAVEKVLGSERYRTFVESVGNEHLIRFNDNCNNDNILKVGSFYECTKNNYPDEFDFIFILGECKYKDEKRVRILTSDLSDVFHEQLKEALDSELDNTFELCQYKGLHGPASKIKLVFNETANIRNRTIYVDISVASRIRFETSSPTELNVRYVEWQQMLLETGSVLVMKINKDDHPKNKTGVKLTITETEQHFVRNKMSEKQRKIYRLLKYIFNGNDANEIIRNLVRKPENKLINLVKFYYGKKVHGLKIVLDIPSYTIKTLMFHHVHQCKKAECNVSECLIELLKDLLVVFNERLDKYTTHFQDWLGGTKGLSVSVDTMLGQPLEMADEYVSAAVIAKRLSKLIKSAEHLGNNRSEIRLDIKDQIPFTERNVNIVESVVDKKRERKVCSTRTTIVLLVITMVVLVGFISASAIANHLAEKACDASSDTPSNTSSYAQYCCDGKKDHVGGWLNVTCSENNTIASNSQTINVRENKTQTTTFHASDTETNTGLANMTETITENTNTSPELKWAFASMAYKLAQSCDNSSESEIEDKRVADFIWNRVKQEGDISENKEKEFYLYCNVTRHIVRVSDDLQVREYEDETCLSLSSSCYTPQHSPFLKITITITAVGNDTVLEHYFCDTGDNCTTDTLSSNQLQVCHENKIGEGTRTEICCSNIDSGPSTNDDCYYYSNLSNLINLARNLAGFFFVTLPGCIIFIRFKREAIDIVKRIRSSM